MRGQAGGQERRKKTRRRTGKEREDKQEDGKGARGKAEGQERRKRTSRRTGKAEEDNQNDRRRESSSWSTGKELDNKQEDCKGRRGQAGDKLKYKLEERNRTKSRGTSMCSRKTSCRRLIRKICREQTR